MGFTRCITVTVLGKPYKQSMTLPCRNSYQSIYTWNDAASGICFKPIQQAKKETNQTRKGSDGWEAILATLWVLLKPRALGEMIRVFFLCENISIVKELQQCLCKWVKSSWGRGEASRKAVCTFGNILSGSCQEGNCCASIWSPFLLWVWLRWMPSVWSQQSDVLEKYGQF